MKRGFLLLMCVLSAVSGCAARGAKPAPPASPASTPAAATQPAVQWKFLASVAANEATQAAAADERFFYAVSSAVVAKYDRLTFQRVAESTPRVHHLNSAYFHAGRLYCAHSNYPEMPERSELMAIDVATMRLSVARDFGNYGGSLTWAVRHDGHWWLNFARYEQNVGQTFLAEFDDQWKELRRFTYPAALLSRLGGKYSLSGGLFRDDILMVSGHDDPVVYRLRLPQTGTVLVLIDAQEVPFRGQGFAVDPVTGGLIGVIRRELRMVLGAPPER